MNLTTLNIVNNRLILHVQVGNRIRFGELLVGEVRVGLGVEVELDGKSSSVRFVQALNVVNVLQSVHVTLSNDVGNDVHMPHRHEPELRTPDNFTSVGVLVVIRG